MKRRHKPLARIEPRLHAPEGIPTLRTEFLRPPLGRRTESRIFVLAPVRPCIVLITQYLLDLCEGGLVDARVAVGRAPADDVDSEIIARSSEVDKCARRCAESNPHAL